jgi:hypothetical protein
MYWIMMRRCLRGICAYWLEIGVAIVLLQYSLKWFLLFWFVQTIYSTTARYEANRCIMRTFQIGNECKIIAIMRSLGVTPEDANKILDEVKVEMTEKQRKHMEDDFRIALG